MSDCYDVLRCTRKQLTAGCFQLTTAVAKEDCCLLIAIGCSLWSS